MASLNGHCIPPRERRLELWTRAWLGKLSRIGYDRLRQKAPEERARNMGKDWQGALDGEARDETDGDAGLGVASRRATGLEPAMTDGWTL